MAILYITEYAGQGLGSRGDPISAGQEPPLAEQAVTFTGTAGQSANLNAKTRFVRIHVDGIASIAVGTNPTAVITNRRMVAGQTEYFGVDKIQAEAGFRISAITNT